MRNIDGVLPHQPGFPAAAFERVKVVLTVLAAEGPFSGDQALTAILGAGITDTAGDISALLDDLEDAGFLQQVAGASPHWTLA